MQLLRLKFAGSLCFPKLMKHPLYDGESEVWAAGLGDMLIMQEHPLCHRVTTFLTLFNFINSGSF